MGNLNPYYNESFVFLVEQEQLRVKRHARLFVRLEMIKVIRENENFTWNNQFCLKVHCHILFHSEQWLSLSLDILQSVSQIWAR